MIILQTLSPVNVAYDGDATSTPDAMRQDLDKCHQPAHGGVALQVTIIKAWCEAKYVEASIPVPMFCSLHGGPCSKTSWP